MNNPVQVSIIIVSYNTRELTRQCLLSLQPEIANLAVEIIVADNGSSDGSCDMLQAEFPQTRLLALGRNLGFGAANNRAAKCANGKYLLLLNSDTLAQPNFLTKLVEFAEARPDAGVVGPKLLNQDRTLQKGCWRFPTLWNAFAESVGLLHLLRRPSNYRTGQYNGVMKVDFAIGACLLIRRDLFEQVGGFDEQFFMYAEETDLCRRLHRLGATVYYNPESRLIHLGGGSQATPGKRLTQFYTSQELYFQKYYGRAGQKAYRAISIFRCILRLGLWTSLTLVRPTLKLKLQSPIATHKWILGWQLGLIQPHS